MNNEFCPKEYSFNVFAAQCASRHSFDQVFSRWGMLVLVKLSEGALRFGALRRAVDGISEKMLSHTLKNLESAGFVLRKEWDEKPPRVEYSLTESGTRIAEAMKTVIITLYEELGKRFSENREAR